MKTRLLMGAAGAALAIGVSSPAAARPGIQLAMASYAAEAGGENAEERARELKAQYSARAASGPKRDCGSPCCSDIKCPECAAGGTDCSDGSCGEQRAESEAQAGPAASPAATT